MDGEKRNTWGLAEWIRLMVLVGLIALIAAGPASGDLWSVVAAAAGEILVQLLVHSNTGRPLPPVARDRTPERKDRPATPAEDENEGEHGGR